jgi:hypothetical protein
MLLVVTVGFTQQASAHHSFAGEFDRNKPITLTGTLTKIEWTNPHGRLFIEVKETSSGTVTGWEIELGNVNGYMRNGWRRDTVKTGDVITVAGFLAIRGSNVASASQFGSITFPDGRIYQGGAFTAGQPGR